MSINKYSQLDLLGQQIRTLEFTQEQLTNCCNQMMKCRQDVYDRVTTSLKIAKYTFLKEQLRLALLDKDTVFYFDLDNVIFDWRAAILQHLTQFTRIDQLNKSEARDQLIAEVYANNPNFFLDLPWMREAAKRIKLLLDNGYKVRFLTATGEFANPAHVSAQKIEALKEYLLKECDYVVPEEDITVVVHSADKKHYAKPGRVLVDDFARNINEFREAGGVAILVDTEDKPEEAAWGIFDGCIGQQLHDFERYASRK